MEPFKVAQGKTSFFVQWNKLIKSSKAHHLSNICGEALDSYWFLDVNSFHKKAPS